LNAKAQSLRDRLGAKELLLGAFLQLGSPVAAEIAARCGLDWALIDLEHGSGSEADLVPQLQGLGVVGTPAIVRVESLSRLRIGRALDLGAQGIMVPQLNDAEGAVEFVRYLRYPPHGARGVGLSARGAGFGTASHEDVGRINESLTGIVQIESEKGVANASEIASVDGVDVLFVGPSDLSHALGVPGNFDHATYMGALGTIADAARGNGKAVGVHIPGTAEFGRYHSLGFRFISIGTDASTLAAGLRNALRQGRDESNAHPN
jgi:2-keto-3-deoxy-L-rhamnonate aldolase RhmA